METKRSCRKLHIEKRNAMTKPEVTAASECICKHLTSSDWYQKSDIIYGYYPLGNEVDCLSFLEKAFADNKRVALPRTREDCAMDFYEIHSLKEVQEGTFHVMEPVHSCPIIEVQEAVVLVPGVVFDRSGNRYGYGKGFYDRYFSRFPKLMRFALAYENQMEELLETLDTDMKMHRIYTERDCYRFHGSAPKSV